MVEQLLSELCFTAQLVDEIKKAFLFFGRQGNPVPDPAAAVGETVIQICLFRTEFFQEFRMDRDHDTFVTDIVKLGKAVAFVLVDEKNIAGAKIIEPVVYQKLLSAGNGVINFIAVMNVDRGGSVVVIQVGDGKALRVHTG